MIKRGKVPWHFPIMKREKYEKILISKQMLFVLMSLVYSVIVSILSTISHKILKISIKRLRKKQRKIPQRAGIAAAAAVHFRLAVSFFIVRRVVEQGQCIRININTHTAVAESQPWAAKI